MELSERKLKILQAIITDYIETAEPVGSRTLSRKYDLGVSAATIRNEMSEMEEEGYLKQLHTSSGRVPSDKAYRLYVDKLMESRILAKIQREALRENLMQKFHEVQNLLKHSAEYLSELTDYTSIAMAEKTKENRIKHLQLVPVDEERILVVLIMDTGLVKNTLLRIGQNLEPQELQKISNFLNQHLQGMEIRKVSRLVIEKIQRELYEYRRAIELILLHLQEVVKEVEQIDVFFSGTTNIFNFPEFNDIVKARSFLAMLEEKELIKNLLSLPDQEGLRVSIGKENLYDIAQECSLVTTTYKIDNRTIGHLSVIGPTRMDYSKVVSIMYQLNKQLNDLLRDKY
ncbi:heat-inducible transcriptional repressor HrcA [Isachenkonia alkalipeptolytica]|uniref:Heat-inducible transcription repressor HrcA n=1 Tax=Isachenkonia alkalipeptolytica TaxID=2565777 RepID=A0AA44BE84_9CLOT|nr:heat-inducible transcriptional repressor HrcA [Isachenkonia alkalipeptolytica]NBG87930.1 heat-inducible transcription repressor HrcA [Isachenkonia alkalipeptolytica]